MSTLVSEIPRAIFIQVIKIGFDVSTNVTIIIIISCNKVAHDLKAVK